MSNLKTPYQYAKLREVSTSYIYQLIEQGKIKTVTRKLPDGKEKRYIDLDKYPIETKK